MNILALILARGGSVRIPGKNLRRLGGKPLISWSIETAKQIPDVRNVLVSTDCEAIRKVAVSEGASAPWLRPARLSTGSASSVDAALHALDWYEDAHGPVDGLMLLQPTSPFRLPKRMLEAVSLYKNHDFGAVVSVSEAPVNPAWCVTCEGTKLQPVLGWDQLLNPVSEDGPYYCLNGSVYLVSPKTLREQQTFLPRNVRPLIMCEDWEAIDIDIEKDWTAAEKYLESGIEI